MQCNKYSLGDNAEFKALMAPYLEHGSHALARILTGVSSYLVEDVCESRQIKTSSHLNSNPTELFKANKRCGLSMIFAMFHKHSEKNHEFMRAMKAALSSLIAVLANKQDTLQTLRSIMKKLIQPAKKMNLLIDWDDSCKPIITFLRELRSSSVAVRVHGRTAVPRASRSRRYEFFFLKK
eukprot:SAG31_NODE_384_length_16414_cov_7.492308_1_plen_180_part_00